MEGKTEISKGKSGMERTKGGKRRGGKEKGYVREEKGKRVNGR